MTVAGEKGVAIHGRVDSNTSTMTREELGTVRQLMRTHGGSIRYIAEKMGCSRDRVYHAMGVIEFEDERAAHLGRPIPLAARFARPAWFDAERDTVVAAATRRRLL